jgi:hypothetical protein
MARNGKIARLPRKIRDELNRRLHNGEQGGSLLAWLNVRPEVLAVLARDFGGSAISKQNLCEWRAGGFAEWQARQETLDQARELASDAREISAATNGKLTDYLATVLAARYAVLLAGWNGQVTDEFRRKLRVTHVLCQDVVELCRSGHSGARLKMEQERLERVREKMEEEIVAHFQRWAKNPAVREWILEDWISPEEREARLREIFGREPKPVKTEEEMAGETAGKIREIYGLPPEPPEPPEAAAPNGDESNPVKPNPTESDPIQPNPTKNCGDAPSPVKPSPAVMS